MPVKGLSVIIPARNEEFLSRTIETVLGNIEGDTEIIAMLDGYWPNPPIKDHPRVLIVHNTVPIGQRAATNDGARISRAKYVMKLDAHCSVDKGFDVKLMENCERDWTVIPRMYNLHAFDWECKKCGERTYQGPKPAECKCGNKESFERVMIWKPRLSRRTDFARFDSDLHFQYWRQYEKRPESKGDIVDVMSSVGACFFMHRKHFLWMGGVDEGHGSWGQFGTEISCKSWLSGGRQVVNKKTWFAHMFRTQQGWQFPYPISGNAQDRAKIYSRDLWFNAKWGKEVKPLRWLVEKFSPVPGWENFSWDKGYAA